MERFQVGSWTVNAVNCTITKDSISETLEPKAMDLLVLLAKADGDLVSRKEIMKTIWHDRYVTDFAVNSLVSNLRKKLNEGEPEEAYIKTRPKRGYLLFAKVTICDEERDDSIAFSTDDENTAAKIDVNEPTRNEDNLVEPIEKIPPISSSPSTSYTSQYKNKKVRKRYVVYALTTILLICAVFIFDLLLSKNERLPASLAVMPFKVISGQEDLSFFADGLAEEVIHQLSVLPETTIISRRSSFTFRNSKLDAVEIAQKLSVAYLLEGSIRQEGDILRVTVQLINGINGSHIWSQVFTANKNEAFSIQGDISREVADTITANFTDFPEEKKRYQSHSSDAYLHVLRGRKYNQTGTVEALLKARDEFIMATKLDPEYANAHVDLATNYLLLAQNKRMSLTDASRLALEAIETAFEIAPQSAEAYGALGILHHYNGRVDEARTAFEKALAINPDQYVALINYANLLRLTFDEKAAITYYQRAKELAPLSDLAYWGIHSINIDFGNFDASRKIVEECLFLQASSSNCSIGLAYNAGLTNDWQRAKEAFEIYASTTSSDSYWFRMGQAWQFLFSGQVHQAAAAYEGLINQFGINIDGLQSIVLTNHASGLIDGLSEKLQAGVEERPESQLMVFNNALHSVLQNRCDIAIGYLEKGWQLNKGVFENADILANTVSYNAYMAYCYQQNGDQVAFNTSIGNLKEQLESLPENELFVPGFVFVKAQYYALSGDVVAMQSQIDLLEEANWPMLWRVEKDPILGQLGR
ncbi:winged helix-turn-helix domain-containing tetratricopeptide repeat protein [Glaciecola sp. 1036]|uniref:winged helix-turn-helix domain-containing tetratricopeptide repeat protein n=1 Tax=Alteromonadaceae TaxID=72275 RepID=UPI003CFD1365